MTVVVMDDVRASMPKQLWAIAVAYKDTVTGKRRTEVKVFGSKSDFKTWYERVKNNWNALMENCISGETGNPMKVTATVFETTVEWSALEFVDSAPSWEPQAPPLVYKKKGKAA